VPQIFPEVTQLRYLVAVASHARESWGINFTSVEPFNEPITAYWSAEGTQEGVRLCVCPCVRARVRACVCASVAGADVVAPRRVSLLAAVAVDRHSVTPPSAGRGRAPCHRTLQCSRRRHAAPSRCCRMLHSWRSTYAGPSDAMPRCSVANGRSRRRMRRVTMMPSQHGRASTLLPGLRCRPSPDE
jgi:hypothetical protein